jgi:ribosomal protein S18 acetylase RimI-like enzyme
MTTLRPATTYERVRIDEHFDGIVDVYRANDWSHASRPDLLRTAVERSDFTLVAIEAGRVVGFVRTMSDGAFAVYIADILVLPECQRRGIGARLMHEVLDHYPMQTFHHQVLIAERGAEGFYRRMGLVPVSAYGLTGFIRTRGS